MEELIKQAFLHVEVVGPQVQEGQYDLIGPDGEIILPTVWERVVQPDWSITMHMWPMERMPQRPPMPPMMGGAGGGPRPVHPHRDGHGPRMAGGMFAGVRPMGHRAGGGGGMGPMPPPPPPGGAGAWAPMGGRPGRGPVVPDIIAVEPGKNPKRVSKGGASVLGWMAGKPKTSGKKYVGPAPILTRSYYTTPYVKLVSYKSVPSPNLPL